MIVTRHPDGRLLGSIRFDGERRWLDLEASNPSDGVAAFYFIVRGIAPDQTTFLAVPWSEVFAARPVLHYSAFVKPNVDFIRYLRQVEREAAERYDRIPPRRRRRHDAGGGSKR